MSQLFSYEGQYFRVEIAEITNAAEPDKTTFVSWCSDGFADVQDAPHQSLARFIGGPPQPSYEDARRYAFDWIKGNVDAKTKRSDKVARPDAGRLHRVDLQMRRVIGIRIRRICRRTSVCLGGREKCRKHEGRDHE